MKRLFLTTIIVLVGIHMAHARGDFRSGWVVLNNGDTLHGLIDFSNQRARSQRCIFKLDRHAPVQVFYPEGAIAYRFTDDKYYVSRKVFIEGEPYQLFLEYLFNGVVDLYSYGGLVHQPASNYLIESGDSLYELKIVREQVKIHQYQTLYGERYRTYLQINNEYKDVLKSLFNQSPDVVTKVDNVSLNHNSLIKISSDYHNEVSIDKQPGIIYRKELPVLISSYGIIFGVGLNNMMVEQGSPYFTFNNDYFNNFIIPGLGFFYSMNFPYFNIWTNIVFEGMYFRRNLQAQHNFTAVNSIEMTDLTFSQHVWQSSLTANYRFPGLGLRPTVQGGVFYNHFFNNRYHSKVDVLSTRGVYMYSTERDTYPFKTFDAGLCVGAGVSGRKWVMDLRYYLGFGMDLNTRTIQWNVGYKIK